MKSEGIQLLPKSAEAEEDEEKGDDKDDIEAPDLSKLDKQVTEQPEGAEAFLKKFLKKQVTIICGEGDKKKARKHKKLFSGSDANLDALIQFLLGK